MAAVPQVARRDRVVTATIVMNALSLASYGAGPIAVGILRAALDWPAVFSH